ncbi:bifunctional molybdenum cofactor biosynthesis protein MoaC/MoaB [Apibacter adventoris]|uniref:bifunctional molybdenum cofactor biosynthesis protein MoaC/MoaB n=1 Tax=Apibacter adventoris TaxID=1679466 RepID=UPI000CF7066D|nr:bifunctional molybdenum cofactor biosynthesis protein MoaC/MoaB [Apibacter adventoris]PQL93597.1 bifunctional molybdenum cofactor biosynthesis protein MoaC/MoaB [Apibacter adventoris]
MVDITYKNKTLRKAIAQAIVKVSLLDTITAIKENNVPKGNVFEMAKTAGLFAAKRTSDMIPDCHPLPIEYTSVNYEINDLQIIITVEIRTIYKTGVEVEAMHAASIVALTFYDMLKPIDKNIEIQNIRLIEKKGGKSDKKDKFNIPLTASVIVCSDSISSGRKEDRAGKIIIDKLSKFGIENSEYIIIPDEITKIQELIKTYCEKKIDMILITGGTGLSKRDVTPEAVKPLLEKEIPGVAEAMRSYGQDRTPLSMLSRSVAGLIRDTLIITLPGSTKGAEESMDSIFPAILHIFKIINGGQHE